MNIKIKGISVVEIAVCIKKLSREVVQTNLYNMNKLFIVLLAVCLASTHAFVKRDAPAPATDANYLETIQKKLTEFSKDFNTQLASTFDPEAIKKNLNSLAESVNKAVEDLKGKSSAPK